MGTFENNVRQIKITFEDAHFARIEESARAVSLSVSNWLKMLVIQEIGGVTPTPRPPGRPPESPTHKQCRKVVKELEKVYTALREGTWKEYPKEFQDRFGEEMEEWQRYYKTDMLTELEDFLKRQPWVK